MITIQTKTTYILAGRTGEGLLSYAKQADALERSLKECGTFWGREDSTTAITITSQQYLDIHERMEGSENGEEEE